MDTSIFEETPIKKKKKKIVIVKKPTPKPKTKRKRRTKAETRAAAIARGINPDQKKLGELIIAYDRLKIKPKGEYVRGKKKKIILNKPKPAAAPKSKKPPPPKKEKKIKPPKPPVKKRRTKLQVLAAIKAAGIDPSLTLKQQKQRLKTIDKARAKVKKAADKKKAEEAEEADKIKYEFIFRGSSYYDRDELEFRARDEEESDNILDKVITVVRDNKKISFLMDDRLISKEEEEEKWYGIANYLVDYRIMNSLDPPHTINSEVRYVRSGVSKYYGRRYKPYAFLIIDMEDGTILKIEKKLDTKLSRILVEWWDKWVKRRGGSQPNLGNLLSADVGPKKIIYKTYEPKVVEVISNPDIKKKRETGAEEMARLYRELKEEEAADKKRREDVMNRYRDGMTGGDRVRALVYKKRKYLLNDDTNVLYGLVDTKAYEIGDIYNYNWNFKNVDTKPGSMEWDWP